MLTVMTLLEVRLRGMVDRYDAVGGVAGMNGLPRYSFCH
jgi:hypothetical protein